MRDWSETETRSGTRTGTRFWSGETRWNRGEKFGTNWPLARAPPEAILRQHQTRRINRYFVPSLRADSTGLRDSITDMASGNRNRIASALGWHR